ncbi:MAG: hypothetical protein HY856_19435 [Burkholderiales bacterium]|nr:hypothetical protein [Burkholderiales bacterium]
MRGTRAWLSSGTLVPLFALSATPAQQYGLRQGPGAEAQAFADWLAGRCAALVSGRP